MNSKKNELIQLNNDYFNIKVKVSDHDTIIDFYVRGEDTTTSVYPDILDIVQAEYPLVLNTHCYNEKNLSFDEEILNTELPHLFEHILIQKLAYKRFEISNIDKEYRGYTEWCCSDDYRNFKIYLNSTVEDMDLLPDVFDESIKIIEKIMSSKPAFK